ncbi:hypothetical protein K1719_022771 [Acacia pycnantha]|nr:hypothetical protein K1719_046843 [Acacia pycnantha]KAI9105055.1 hypothetical protein K1719_022771 [Acacia pycnantha]
MTASHGARIASLYMEPSQASGEFSGDNESGWTAYIGSHIHTETSYSDDEDVKSVEDDGNNGHNDDDDESDDSMASDASSGPSNLQYLGINSEGSRGSDQFRKHKDNDHKSLFPGKKTSKQASKRRYGRNAKVKEEEEEDDDESLVEAGTAASSHV